MKIKNLLIISGLMAIIFVSRCHADWDVTTPAGTEAKSLGDDRIRELKTDIQEALNTYGVFPGTDAANPKYYWTISSGTTVNRPTSVSTGTLFVNVSSGCIERYLGAQGWACIQTVNPSFEFNASTAIFTTLNELAYDYVTGAVTNIVSLRNTAADTSTATASLRFWVGNANEAKIVGIRDVSDSAALDLAINVRRAGNRYEPQKWKSDGTIVYNSSNTYYGSNQYQSSTTFNGSVNFNGSTVFGSITSFLVTATTTASNVTGNNVIYGVIFSSEVYDAGNNVSNSTFTAPATAKYYLTACVTTDDLTASTHNRGTLSLKTSNRIYVNSIFDAAASPNESSTDCISVLADMDAGDIASVDVVVAGSSQDVDVFGLFSPPAGQSGVSTYFSGYQIR